MRLVSAGVLQVAAGSRIRGSGWRGLFV